ncbi:MAG: M23 family metallopeptidase [Pseudonocardiaceae bacterium]
MRQLPMHRRYTVTLVAFIVAMLTVTAPGLAVADIPVTTSTSSGCVDWPTTKFLQSPLTKSANGGLGYAMQNGSYYGEDLHINCDKSQRMNQFYALDIGQRQGDQVLAPGGAGTVLFAGWAPSGWQTCGQYIIVDHGGGWWSVVCHLSKVLVSKGQQVTNDTVIGLVGGTGGFAPHLHFSLQYNAKLTAAGGVYGGQSAQPRHMMHLSCGGGYYEYIQKGQKVCY